MIRWTKRQKYIKEKYFKIVDRNPLHYAPLCDDKLKLTVTNLGRVIDLIINVLEEEQEGEINWVKIT